MLDEAAALFGDLFSRLADPGRLPAVIHCLGGKDRTGITIALLLSALDVERAVVLNDYQFTNDCRGVAHVPEVIEVFVESGIAREAAEERLQLGGAEEVDMQAQLGSGEVADGQSAVRVVLGHLLLRPDVGSGRVDPPGSAAEGCPVLPPVGRAGDAPVTLAAGVLSVAVAGRSRYTG